MSPSIKVFKHDGDRRFEINEPIENCHFLYQQMDLTAALSFCQKDSVVRTFTSSEHSPKHLRSSVDP